MHQSTVHNLSWVPISIIGLLLTFLGIVILFHPQPWMINKYQNEIILNTSFVNLFLYPATHSLQNYLKLIYAFCGCSLFGLGFVILLYSYTTRFGTLLVRNVINFGVFIILAVFYRFSYGFSPESIFSSLFYVLSCLLLCSVYFSRKIID